MNKYSIEGEKPVNNLTRIMKVMRITLLFLFTGILFCQAKSGYSQGAELSLELRTASIKEVCEEIEKKSDYRFIFAGDVKDIINEEVKLTRQTKDIEEILDHILATTGLLYDIFDNQVVVYHARNKSLANNNEIHRSEKITQQKREVRGKIVDINNVSIIGANIVEKGTTNGTITDMDGNFSLQVEDNAVLHISYIGYLSQDINTTDENIFNITLLEDTQALEEIVVIGYGTQRKGEVASAITTVRSDDFVKVPAPDAAQLIRGQVPGLAIVSPGGDPTSTSQILLRGTTTLTSSMSPLIIIDGVPGALNSISPDEIDQIDVLKDGSAAAIYGTRGTNGVIIITTKNARGDLPTTIDVNSYLSTQQITRRLPFMTYDEYMDKVTKGVPGAQDNGGQTDWMNEILQTPFSQVYNISLRGGSRDTNYTASFEYRGLEGIVKRSNNNMIYPRIEITHRMFDNKLRVNGGLSGYTQEYHSGGDGGSFNNAVYRNALNFSPADPIKDLNGSWYQSPSKTDYSNPLALLYETEGKNQSTNLRMHSMVSFMPIDRLEIRYLASLNVLNQVRGYYETQKHLSTVKDNRDGFSSRGTTRSVNEQSELTAQYNTTISRNHNLTILAGYSWLKQNYQNYWMQNWIYPSDDYTYNAMQNGQALRDGRANMNSYQSENKLIGYFGRVNYNYKGRYILAASVRYEGSTKFGTNHKWGTFPSVSGAWNIVEEDFVNDNSVLSTLKLRVGFGVTGNEPSDPYRSLNTLNFGDYIYYNQEWMKSIRPNENPNPDLRWEKKEETNIGIDFGFFNERLGGSIDYYYRYTKDLLWNYEVPSPPYIFNSMYANAGKIENKGVELAVRATPFITNNFRWDSNLNFSTNSNVLLSLSDDKFISKGWEDTGGTGEPLQQPTHRLEEGKPIGNFYGFKSIDIDENGHWIIEGEDGNPKPISQQQPTDKKVIGNSLPSYYLNWNNSIQFRKFDLGITMRGAFDFQVLNMPALQYGAPVMMSRGNVLKQAFENVYGKTPLAYDQELQYVSYYIEDADYWKIDNVTLGYTFDLGNKWIQNCRIYGSVNNLVTFTGYSGIDPEVQILGLSPGIDNKNRYPMARTYTFGVSLKF